MRQKINIHLSDLSAFFSNKEVVDITDCPRCVICYHCIQRQSNRVAPPSKYVENFHYLLEHGAHVVIDNATCNGPICENVIQNKKQKYVVFCSRTCIVIGRGLTAAIQLICTENYVKLGRVDGRPFGIGPLSVCVSCKL